MSLLGKKTPCQEKIDELCGSVMCSDEFHYKARLFRYDENPINSYEKKILNDECVRGKLAFDDIDARLNELLKLDSKTLFLDIRNRLNKDTSIFKTQDDIDRVMGVKYAGKYHMKLEKKKAKMLKQFQNYDFSKGVKVNLVTPNKIRLSDDEVLTISEDLRRKDSFKSSKTTVQILENEVVFKNVLIDFSDLKIPFEAIEYVEKANSEFLNIYLKNNQIIKINFIIRQFMFEPKIRRFITCDFIHKVSKNHSHSPSFENIDDLVEALRLFEDGKLTKDEFERIKYRLSDSKTCPECKSPLGENDSFCPHCGRNII